jgi:hypothetical protein
MSQWKKSHPGMFVTSQGGGPKAGKALRSTRQNTKEEALNRWVAEQTDEGELGAAYEDIEEILDVLGYPMSNVRSGRQEPANHGLMNKVQSRRPIIIFFSLSNSWYFF